MCILFWDVGHGSDFKVYVIADKEAHLTFKTMRLEEEKKHSVSI